MNRKLNVVTYAILVTLIYFAIWIYAYWAISLSGEELPTNQWISMAFVFMPFALVFGAIFGWEKK